ncbi:MULTISPECIES: ATP-binding protein [unclassified Streptomyces]|uniref:ATP-binding protein n=1 Tax=unclassified Streptomyces TaxID=2593676 RepID=UPI00136A052D|nr:MULTISPECIES: ATP-binding protein [unclassified Streptomyces]MCW5253873.1 ATP-binding protein [Streptomyces sp. SHP 1-2]MYU23558.1 ATP-binding protein [Streptomyces sp. SID8352]
MSTTRPCSPGDRGPEPGASGASAAPEGGAPGSGRLGDGAPGAVPVAPGAPAAPAGRATGPGDARTPATAPEEPPGGDAGAGGRVRRLSLADRSGVVPLARDFTREALHAWGWLPSATADQRAAAEDVLLVVSELVTNACLHAEGPEELRITCDRKVIRLEVSDRGTGQPAPRTPHRAGRPGGHGMFIVQRLCLDWGVVRTPGVAGKRVWAELGAPA